MELNKERTYGASFSKGSAICSDREAPERLLSAPALSQLSSVQKNLHTSFGEGSSGSPVGEMGFG